MSSIDLTESNSSDFWSCLSRTFWSFPSLPVIVKVQVKCFKALWQNFRWWNLNLRLLIWRFSQPIFFLLPHCWHTSLLSDNSSEIAWHQKKWVGDGSKRLQKPPRESFMRAWNTRFASILGHENLTRVT
ncbi:hypothetical protein QN277_011678 [Acacia crassicarpa]|uniref:Uncharacterized protein n=1 Tax=Acacia crassicarpa TaxID=499986 RepID=A0AAE1TC11_9FABA|nr:hypothetical protein QN277_011678 [Acacia crassicarpa]